MYDPDVVDIASAMDRQRRAAELLQKLAQGGYRRPPQRLLIVEALLGDESHPTAEEIFARVRQVCPTTSLATVYRKDLSCQSAKKAPGFSRGDSEAPGAAHWTTGRASATMRD